MPGPEGLPSRTSVEHSKFRKHTRNHDKGFRSHHRKTRLGALIISLQNQARRPGLRPFRETSPRSSFWGLDTITERLGSARCFACSENQLRKPNLRPFRDNSLTSSDPTLDRAETSLKRSGSPSCFGCTKNELRRFIVRPARDESCVACGLRVVCVWIACGFRVDCVWISCGLRAGGGLAMGALTVSRTTTSFRHGKNGENKNACGLRVERLLLECSPAFNYRSRQ